MLRWIPGITRKDRVTNKSVRNEIGGGKVREKIKVLCGLEMQEKLMAKELRMRN